MTTQIGGHDWEPAEPIDPERPAACGICSHGPDAPQHIALPDRLVAEVARVQRMRSTWNAEAHQVRLLAAQHNTSDPYDAGWRHGAAWALAALDAALAAAYEDTPVHMTRLRPAA